MRLSILGRERAQTVRVFETAYPQLQYVLVKAYETVGDFDYLLHRALLAVQFSVGVIPNALTSLSHSLPAVQP